MKDTLTSENFQDFRRRYEGTYGIFSHKVATPLLVMLQSVEENRVNFMDKKGFTYHALADAGIPFEFLPVERKLVNTPDGDVLFSCRKPARMWRRGVCADNTTITRLGDNRALKVTFDNLELLYNKEANNKAAYEEYLSGKRKLVALSDKFCIKDGNVFLYNLNIGSYADEAVKLAPIVKQEFSDLVARNKYSIKVSAHEQ